MQANVQFVIDPATKLEGRKISPHGVITLPFVARLALGFKKGESARLDVTVDHDAVRLSPARPNSATVVRSSPRGLLQLSQDAHRTLTANGHRHYKLAIDEKRHELVLQSV